MTRLSFDQSDLHHRPRADRGVSRRPAWLLILGMSLFAAGCDTFTFSPPRPAELSESPPHVSAGVRTKGEVSTANKTVEVILTPRIEMDAEVLKSAVRLQAGIDKVRTQVAVPPETAPASAQVELLRKAIERKPAAIVLETPAAPTAELIQAVADARKAGVLIVYFGRPPVGSDASASNAGRPLVAIVSEPLKKSAASLVANAVRAAKNGKIATDTGAVILFDPTVDSLVQDRVEALRDALKAAGVKKVEELRFEKTINDAQKKLIAYLDAHPETTLVLGVDAGGLQAADQATGDLKEKHRYAIAGYTDNEVARNQVMMGEYAAVGVFGVDRLLRRGLNIAAESLKGGDVPERVEIEVPVVESSPAAGLPRMRVTPPDKPKLEAKPGAAPTEK
jgi:ABC-type sugar transport system substrate-binding protein